MQPGRLTLLFLVLPGAGFIFLFLAAAIVMTLLQSIGLYAIIGESRLTGEFWLSLLDRTFLDSFLFSLKVGVGSAFGTLLLAYPLAGC
jgi:ABC-type spermidine/putrescine transport system permease subunit I